MSIEQQYREAEGWNWSRIKYLKESPLDFKIRINQDDSPSEHMKLGSFVDCGLLTPDELEERYIKIPTISWPQKHDERIPTIESLPADFCLFADKEAEELKKFKKEDFLSLVDSYYQSSGKIPVPETGDVFSWEKGIKIIQNNQNKRAFLEMMANVEVLQDAVFATCPITGLKLKGLIDIQTIHALVDLKTVGTIGKRFYNIRAFDYLGQIAFYDYLLRLCGINKKNFSFCFIETCSPYKMKFVHVEEAVIRQEHEKNISLLKLLKQCLDREEWPDGSEEADIWEYRETQEPMSDKTWLEQAEQPGQYEL